MAQTGLPFGNKPENTFCLNPRQRLVLLPKGHHQMSQTDVPTLRRVFMPSQLLIE